MAATYDRTAGSPSRDFYAGIPIFEGFARVLDPTLYRPLPDDWVVGLTDIVESSKAIQAGRYKTVNTAGASTIAAVANALGNRDFPFVFGGDGASFAVSATDAATARDALAATATWAREDLDLSLRAALVPVSAVRERGWDVRVARFAPSAHVSYAMFSGGGLAWAEKEAKRGAFAVSPAPPGTRPDLTGLSCRFEEIPAQRGIILSLIVTPGRAADQAAFRALAEDVLTLAANASEAGRPVPETGPPIKWLPTGLDLEARASRRAGRPLLLRRLTLAGRMITAALVFRLGIRVGRFDPAVYRRELVENTDFRKYDDGLRMTLDCTPELADRIQARLASAEATGVARFGLHRQASALMTCFVPSIHHSDHVHFVDGAAGGYAAAARELKAALG